MYPTFVELCDLTNNGANADLQPLDGTSLASTLKAPDQAKEREVIISYLQAHEYAITNRDWRYIRYGDGQEELYNHNNDPHEWDNLARDPAYELIHADMRSKSPASPADFALLHRQYTRRDRDDGTWYFADQQVKVNLTLSSNASDVVTGDFDVTAQFTTGVTGFDADDLKATNGSVLKFTQVSPEKYTFTVRPQQKAIGESVVIEVPKTSATGIPNPRETNDEAVFVERRLHPDAAGWIPPTASAAVTSASGLTVYFDSSGSTDDGTFDHCVWQFGDGTVSTGKNPSHTYARPGSYVVTLGVTDEDGVGSDLATITVIVSDGTPELK